MLRDLIRRAVPRSLRLAILHPVQSARWLRHALLGKAGGAVRVRMRDDWEIRCHPAAAQAFAFERDQPELRDELEGFMAACRDGMALFDIGSHYGLFALAALRWSHGSARVVAIDPSTPAVEVFDANMRLAGAGPNVQRYCAALGETEGETFLLTGGAGAWHMMVKADESRAGDAMRVQTTTLDALAARTGLAPTHVKIDVEGEEDSVIRGGAAVLQTHQPIVFLELHCGMLRKTSRSPAAVLERLRSLGYERFEIAGRPVSFDEAVEMDVARIVCRP